MNKTKVISCDNEDAINIINGYCAAKHCKHRNKCKYNGTESQNIKNYKKWEKGEYNERI